MTLTQEPQIAFGETVVENDTNMEELLERWDETLEPAAANKQARKDINQYAPKEPGVYRYGIYTLTVTNKVSIKIDKPEESAE